MLKIHTNHQCHKVPALVQIPKPLQKSKNIESTSILHTQRRIKTIGYNQYQNGNKSIIESVKDKEYGLTDNQKNNIKNSIEDILLKDKDKEKDMGNDSGDLWSFRVGNTCQNNTQKYVKMEIEEVSQP